MTFWKGSFSFFFFFCLKSNKYPDIFWNKEFFIFFFFYLNSSKYFLAMYHWSIRNYQSEWLSEKEVFNFFFFFFIIASIRIFFLNKEFFIFFCLNSTKYPDIFLLEYHRSTWSYQSKWLSKKGVFHFFFFFVRIVASIRIFFWLFE